MLLFALAQAAVLSLAMVIGLLVLACVILGIFVVYERSVAEPIWPMSLWRDRMATSGNLVSLALGVDDDGHRRVSAGLYPGRDGRYGDWSRASL